MSGVKAGVSRRLDTHNTCDCEDHKQRGESDVVYNKEYRMPRWRSSLDGVKKRKVAIQPDERKFAWWNPVGDPDGKISRRRLLSAHSHVCFAESISCPTSSLYIPAGPLRKHSDGTVGINLVKNTRANQGGDVQISDIFPPEAIN